jgi:hypothetical protein
MAGTENLNPLIPNWFEQQGLGRGFRGSARATAAHPPIAGELDPLGPGE